MGTARMPSSEFVLHVGTGPDGDLDLRREIALTKVGVLFADRVVLSSPNMALHRSILHDSQDPALWLEAAERLGLLPQMHPEVSGRRVESSAVEVARVFGTPRVIELVEAGVRDAGRIAREQLHELFEHAGGHELIAAERAGVLEVDMLGAGGQGLLARAVATSKAEPLPDSLLEEILDRMLEAATRARYPLLDHEVARLVRELVRADDSGRVSPNFGKRLKLAGFTDVVLSTLPLASLSMEQMLEIRAEVRPSAVEFRAAMHEFSRELASHPWDPDFVAEAKHEFELAIRPKLEQLAEALRDSTVVRRVGRSLKTELRNPVVVTLGTVLASFGVLLTDLNPALLVSAAVLLPTAEVIARARAMLHERDALEHRGLALYCQADAAAQRFLRE